jgi:hypothetical protein
MRWPRPPRSPGLRRRARTRGASALRAHVDSWREDNGRRRGSSAPARALSHDGRVARFGAIPDKLNDRWFEGA